MKRRVGCLAVLLLVVIIPLAVIAASSFFDGTIKMPSTQSTTTQDANLTPVKGASGAYYSSTPVWQDDFSTQSDGSVNKTKWNVYVGTPVANKEAQYYSDSLGNLRIENGALVLETHRETVDLYEYTSAKIDTSTTMEFQYGKFDIYAKLPTGIGTWPAIWLYPTQNTYGGDSNAKNTYFAGEMDIMEAVGADQNSIYGIAHSATKPADGYYGTKLVKDADKKYHHYILEWSPTSLTFKIDKSVIYQVKKQDGATYKTWPYDQKYYLIINLAMGGTWAGMLSKEYPPYGIDDSSLPAKFCVKSVSYYKYMGDNLN